MAGWAPLFVDTGRVEDISTLRSMLVSVAQVQILRKSDERDRLSRDIPRQLSKPPTSLPSQAC